MIYVLSILDHVHSLSIIVAVSSVAIGLFMVASRHDVIHRCGARSDERYADSWREIDKIERLYRRLFLAGAISALAAGALPSTDSLMRAYVMAECRKVITAENAEAATKALLDRADKLIDAIGKR